MIPKNLKSKGFLWVFAGILILSAMLFSASTLPKCLAETSSPLILVVPPQTTLTSATVGTLFNVSVDIANTTGFAGVQFTLSWNTSLLMCTQMTEVLFHDVTPQSDWTNIWDLSPGIDNTAGTGSYAVTYMNAKLAQSDGYSPINVTTANFPDGEETVDTFTFNVTSVPSPNNVYQSDFTLGGVVIGNVNGSPLTITSVNGQYVIYGPPETVTSSVVSGNGTTYNVITVSNATVVPESVTYNPATFTLSFNVTVAPNEGTTGYVNATIPLDLVSLASGTTWNVTVNGTPVTPSVTSDSVNTYLYFTTPLVQTQTVQVVGTLPELPVLMLIPLLMIATLFAVELRKRKQA